VSSKNICPHGTLAYWCEVCRLRDAVAQLVQVVEDARRRSKAISGPAFGWTRDDVEWHQSAVCAIEHARELLNPKEGPTNE